MTQSEQDLRSATLEAIAAAMWWAEAVDVGAPKSISDARTPAAFAQQSATVRTKWLRFALVASDYLREAIAAEIIAKFGGTAPYKMVAEYVKNPQGE